MNNGVNNTNNSQPSNTEQPVLMPMEGVKIAPVDEGPVDASSTESATQTVAAAKASDNSVVANPVPQPAVNPVVANQPVQTEVNPVVEEPQPTNTAVPQEVVENKETKPVKKKINIVPILLLIILIFVAYTVYSSLTHKRQIEKLNYECTPVTASKDTVKLDLNSTLVKELYRRVKTDIEEDLAQPEFNDNMRLYLAYRQLGVKDIYDSNCNLFNPTAMEPYTCVVSTEFVPKAFKEETLKQKLKELYGEKTEIPLQNIRLGEHSCVGGYQYIANRGEFVQGYCGESIAIPYKVDKELKEATSTRNSIVLVEEVKYHENEKLSLPDSLKSGMYYYTFRLDMNYNYVLVSKTYQSKY